MMPLNSMKIAAIQEHAIQQVRSHYNLPSRVGSAVRAVGDTFKSLGAATNDAVQGFRQFHGMPSMDSAGKMHDYSLRNNLGNSLRQFHNTGGTKALGQVAAGTALVGAGAYGAKRLLYRSPQQQPQQQQQQPITTG